MKKTLSFVALAAVATVLLSVPSAANAQAAFGGTFRGPHGSFSIGVGAPFAPVVGAYVPYPYVEQVYQDPDYGYGFYYDSQWVPCRPYGSRWIIAGAPVVYGYGGYGGRYVRRYGYARPYSYARPYFYGRYGYGSRFHRRSWDGRSWDGRSWDGRRW